MDIISYLYGDFSPFFKVSIVVEFWGRKSELVDKIEQRETNPNPSPPVEEHAAGLEVRPLSAALRPVRPRRSRRSARPRQRSVRRQTTRRGGLLRRRSALPRRTRRAAGRSWAARRQRSLPDGDRAGAVRRRPRDARRQSRRRGAGRDWAGGLRRAWVRGARPCPDLARIPYRDQVRIRDLWAAWGAVEAGAGRYRRAGTHRWAHTSRSASAAGGSPPSRTAESPPAR